MMRCILLIFTVTLGLPALADCDRTKLAGSYASSATVFAPGLGQSPLLLTGRFILRQGGGVAVPFWSGTIDGESLRISAEGNWNVNAGCVGFMDLEVNFSTDDNQGQRVRIDFTAAGTGDAVSLKGIYRRTVGPAQSGAIEFDRRNF